MRLSRYVCLLSKVSVTLKISLIIGMSAGVSMWPLPRALRLRRALHNYVWQVSCMLAMTVCICKRIWQKTVMRWLLCRSCIPIIKATSTSMMIWDYWAAVPLWHMVSILRHQNTSVYARLARRYHIVQRPICFWVVGCSIYQRP